MVRFGLKVFVVDNDPAVRDSMAVLVSSLGFDCEAFSSAEQSLKAMDVSQPGCIVAELHPEGVNAFDFQKHLADFGSVMPVVFVGSNLRVEDAVQAMRLGAVSVLEKPYSVDQLAEAICESAAISRIAQATKQRLAVLRDRLETLDPREREVMAMIVDGLPNKTIARKLGVCQRTAAQIRADVFEKMGAGSAVDLAIMASDLWKLNSAETLIPAIAPCQINALACDC